MERKGICVVCSAILRKNLPTLGNGHETHIQFEHRFSSVDLVSFHEVALYRPEQRDRSTATLCSKTGSSDDEEEQEQLIGKPNRYVRLDIG